MLQVQGRGDRERDDRFIGETQSGKRSTEGHLVGGLGLDRASQSGGVDHALL